MRSARTAIVAVTAMLVLLPFLLLSVAWVYERFLVSAQLLQLAQLGDRAATMSPSERTAFAENEGVWLRAFSPDGGLQYDSRTETRAESFSFLGGAFERAFTAMGAASATESLGRLDLQSPPMGQREELRSAWSGVAAGSSRTSLSGASIVIAWARPAGNGAALMLTRANHRGVRQLLLARNQLVKLVLLQLLIAMLVALLLSRWLVKPLEQLARGARAFPTRAIADAPLTARRDELGQVARAFNELTESLEARRTATVQLAADMAHELKNPLATIEAASELMASTRDPSLEKRAQLHSVIHEAVRRLQRTAESLVAEVRLETALAQAPRETISYGGFLENLLQTYRLDPRREGWRFELDLAADLTLTVNAEAWSRLLRNLIDNALAQPAAKPALRLEVSASETEVTTDVIDFGPGVSEGNRDKVFRRFFTARPEGAEPGTGLGLSIVEAIAFAHGGRVTLLPADPNRGAAFRVTLAR